jgi:hypothetical protein
LSSVVPSSAQATVRVGAAKMLAIVAESIGQHRSGALKETIRRRGL